MLIGLIDVFFCKSEVDHEDFAHVVSFPDQEIVGFDIAMQNASRVYVLDKFKHLTSDENSCLEREFPAA